MPKQLLLQALRLVSSLLEVADIELGIQLARLGCAYVIIYLILCKSVVVVLWCIQS